MGRSILSALVPPLFACVFVLLAPFSTDGQVPTDARDPLLAQGPKAVATGDSVMVSTQLASVTEAALQVLREGGNAVDAALTATFLQGVQDYHQNHLFGSLTGLYFEAATGRYYSFNGYVERPRADRCGEGDPNRVAIGGKMPALKQLWERFGTLPWEQYLEPAIAAAEEGVLVTSFMYATHFSSSSVQNLIRTNREAHDFFMPEGHLVPVGHRWKMPSLAETLREIQTDPTHMITGDFVRRFIEEARSRGGCVSMDDYEEYEVLWEEPLRFTYRGHEIITEPPPVAGGQMLGYNLNILENFPLTEMGHYSRSPETLEILGRTLARVDGEVRWAMGDPRSFHVPSDLWLSDEYGRMGAEFVRQTMSRVDLSPPATDGSLNEASRSGLESAGSPLPDDSDHNVIVDAEGNWITFLHTLHGGMPGVFLDGVPATGSGRWTPTSGPGRRAGTHVAATFVARDGVPWLALGSPGTPAQPITQALVNILDFGMTPAEAADAPKFWAYQNLGPSDDATPTRDFGNLVTFQIESRISNEVRRGIASRGMQIFDRGDYSWNIGSIQVIWLDSESGLLHGASDPRRLGHAAGY